MRPCRGARRAGGLVTVGLLVAAWPLRPPATAHASGRCNELPPDEGKEDESGGAPSGDVPYEAAEADEAEPRQERSTWNEYDGRFFTARFGGGLLGDYAAFDQNAASQEQLTLDSRFKLRDFRLLLNGRFKFAPRVSYTLSYMWDGADDVWRFRQTGLMVDVPEIDGGLFIGRTKEGFSTNRLMVGYNGFTMERATANDAFLPILADGVKWTGRGFGGHLVYNVGGFIDVLTNDQPFNKNDWQVAARAVWLPLEQGASKPTLHLALEGRYGDDDNGTLEFRSKPESFVAQEYVVDTGAFAASGQITEGAEVYYQNGPWILGSEYFLNQTRSKKENNPFFHGGEVMASYILGGVRPYDHCAALFEAAYPTHPVLSGGLGALELVLRVSYIDLDSEAIDGGRFWRFTPGLSWYLTRNVRLEAAYGYSKLNRDDLVGTLQLFQARLQLTLN